ncbi:MAG: hypothetical protein OXG95_00280 [Chloroflexi bacterium]|nr:hypothetical protein [Chloroflexota bacterium]
MLVPPERAADLRDYYHKHSKRDRLDSRLLARLPLLHPEGLHDEHGVGPGDLLPRATRLCQSPVQRRTMSLARSTRCSSSSGLGGGRPSAATSPTRNPLRFLTAGYACPDTVTRLGWAWLSRFLHHHSRSSRVPSRMRLC